MQIFMRKIFQLCALRPLCVWLTGCQVLLYIHSNIISFAMWLFKWAGWCESVCTGCTHMYIKLVCTIIVEKSSAPHSTWKYDACLPSLRQLYLTNAREYCQEQSESAAVADTDGMSVSVRFTELNRFTSWPQLTAPDWFWWPRISTNILWNLIRSSCCTWNSKIGLIPCTD